MQCHLRRALFKGQECIEIKKIQTSGHKEVHRKIKNLTVGNFLVVQWLGLCSFIAKGPGWGTKIPQAAWPKKKQNQTNNNKTWLCPTFFPLVFLSSRYLVPNPTESPPHFPSSPCFLTDNSLGSYLYSVISQLALTYTVYTVFITFLSHGALVLHQEYR